MKSQKRANSHAKVIGAAETNEHYRTGGVLTAQGDTPFRAGHSMSGSKIRYFSLSVVLYAAFPDYTNVERRKKELDQKKIGRFFKMLRKEKGLTQEQLAEHFNVTGRTVSRWETGNNMPDLDILVEMADYYDVDLRELLDGERKSEKMNKDLEETVLKVADYSSDEKMRLMKKLHIFSWVGVLCFMAFIILEGMGLADSGITENIASLCAGISFGMLIIAVIYTSKYISKIKSFKKRVFQHR